MPGEVNGGAEPKAVQNPLRRGVQVEPAQGDEVLAGRFDITGMDAEDLGNPGGFTEAPGVALLVVVVQAAAEMAQDGGDDRRPAPLGNEAHDLARHGHPAPLVGDAREHGMEGSEIVVSVEIREARGKPQAGVGPGEEAYGFETSEGGAQILPSPPADEPMQFRQRIERGVSRGELAAPGSHLVGRIPDTQVEELDQALGIGPPEERELLDREQNKATEGFSGTGFFHRWQASVV